MFSECSTIKQNNRIKWAKNANIWPKMSVLGQIWPFLGQKIQFLAEVSKSFGTHITEKLPMQLVHIVLWSGMVSNGSYMPHNEQTI